MLFKNIIGQEHIKKHLSTSVDQGRIPHAQLFIGPEGSGTLPMALAYAQYILCHNNTAENTTGDAVCNMKCNNFNHPDIHFAFPVTTSSKIKSKPKSKDYIEEWRELLKTQPYANIFDWYKLLGVDNKQGEIRVEDAQHIIKDLSLKSYEGGYKIMIIWMAEKMNTACANKLLKLIEEPPKNTLLLLLAEDEDQLLKTITSRCQIIHFPPLSETQISKNLVEQYNIDPSLAQNIARQSNGNFNKAINLINNDSEDNVFEEWFVFWVRAAFKAKGNKSVINDLINWSQDIAKTGRETQKQFLLYCIEIFRQAMLYNYNAKEIVYYKPNSSFKLEKFAPFIHGNNILDIIEALEEAIYHIERNGNANIILTDLSIQLTRFIHKKA